MLGGGTSPLSALTQDCMCQLLVDRQGLEPWPLSLQGSAVALYSAQMVCHRRIERRSPVFQAGALTLRASDTKMADGVGFEPTCP